MNRSASSSVRGAIGWRERVCRLRYTYAAIGIGLLAALLTGSVHWDTLNFQWTTLIALTVVTLFDWLVLEALKEEVVTPSQFLLRMMILVVVLQTAFACVYHWAGDSSSYLVRSGVRVTDFVDALYFSGVTLLTVGYGDIVPVGDFRFTAVAEVYGGTLFIFAFFTWGLGIMADRHLKVPSKRS